MESDVVEGIYKDVVRGASKAKCAWVTDEESGAFWDKVAAQVKEISDKHPNAQFEMVHEIP